MGLFRRPPGMKSRAASRDSGQTPCRSRKRSSPIAAMARRDSMAVLMMVPHWQPQEIRCAPMDEGYSSCGMAGHSRAHHVRWLSGLEGGGFPSRQASVVASSQFSPAASNLRSLLPQFHPDALQPDPGPPVISARTCLDLILSGFRSTLMVERTQATLDSAEKSCPHAEQKRAVGGIVWPCGHLRSRYSCGAWIRE